MSRAEEDVTQPQRDQLANGGLIVNPACKPCDLMEDIDAKLYQLIAALHMTHGCGGDSFRNWSAAIQDGYLWGLRESLEQVNALWQRYAQVMRHETFAKS